MRFGPQPIVVLRVYNQVTIALPCLVLAGGLGKRLWTISEGYPKPLMEVGGRPFIEYIVGQLAEQGFTNIVLCTGYRGELFEEHCGDGGQWGVRIRYSREPRALGTGGALKRAANLFPSGNYIALNGDSLLDADIHSLIDLHIESGAAATIALAQTTDASRFGRVLTNAFGRVTRFVEKDQADAASGWINGGIYVLNHSAIDAIPDGNVSLEREVFPQLLTTKAGVYGLSFPGFFVDMGVPHDYVSLSGDPERLDKWLMNPQHQEVLC